VQESDATHTSTILARHPLTSHDGGVLTGQCWQDMKLDGDQRMISSLLYCEGFSAVKVGKKGACAGPTHIPRFVHILHIPLPCILHDPFNAALAIDVEGSVIQCLTSLKNIHLPMVELEIIFVQISNRHFEVVIRFLSRLLARLDGTIDGYVALF